MDAEIYTPKTISVANLLRLKSEKVKPIDGLNIPHITVPSHLISKKRSTEPENKIVVDMNVNKN